jgi:nucleoside-diphosphate-sugar epimerase
MRALVTGATGKVGNAVTRALAARGDEVRVLVRDPERARRWIPEGVEAVKRDVTERIPPQLSPAVAKAVSPATEGIVRVTRRPPLIPRGQLYFFMWNAAPDSSKAQRELGWEPTRLEDGVRATLETLDL